MQHLKKGSRPNKVGVSLIELCCVIAIIVSMSSLAWLKGLWLYRSFTVRMELHRLKAACIYVRRKALVEARSQKIVFDKNGASYQHEKVVHLAQGVSFAILNHVKGPPGDPRTILTEAITYQSYYLEAYHDGTLSAGTVYLSDSVQSCLYALTTDASAITAIRCYVYNESTRKWDLL